jgi:ankyrin repeat protein
MLRELKDISTSKKRKGIAVSSSGQSNSTREADTTSPVSDYEPTTSQLADQVDWSWLNFDTANLPTTLLGSPMMEVPEVEEHVDDLVSCGSDSTKLKSEPSTSPENTPKAEILTPQNINTPIVSYERNTSAEQDFKLEPKLELTNPIIESKPSGAKENGSIMTTSTRSLRSVISLGSLKKRLQSRYSGSFLHDIKSLMDRLTISESSETSSTTSIKTVYYSRRTIARVTEPIVVLPGYFPQFCWEHLNVNELERCDDLPIPCSQGPIYSPLGLETHRSMRADVMFRIRSSAVRKDDLECTDAFGNTVLHVASTLGARPSYLSHLITMGADPHRLNVAGQNFMHLIYISEIPHLSELQYLIGTLVKKRFDFEQQDDNGQTIFHALFQSSIPEDILNESVQCFQYHGIVIPKSRDCLGNTVMKQYRRATFSTLPPPSEEFEGFDRTLSIATNQASIMEDFTCPSDFNLPRIPVSPEIQNLEDLQNYELHADLLRTILRATDNPAFEDSGGRNGLHCLAAVRLDLPIPNSDDEQDTQTPKPVKDHLSLRERYLEQLLLSGVDPNMYDRQGTTPFIAFVANLREDEDDNMTAKILDRLCNAGANINRRNRKGETALHIAVKYGRRAATKFLIARGANVHARTTNGIGILSLGLKHSDRASHDDVLYAQISLCISLVAGAGAVSAPTILREWASEDFRVAPDREAINLPKVAAPPKLPTQNYKSFYGTDKYGSWNTLKSKSWVIGGLE